MNSSNYASLINSKKRLSNEGDADRTLRIRYDKNLATILGISTNALHGLARNAPQYYHEFSLNIKGKDRILVEATGLLKKIQYRILSNLLRRLAPYKSSFGGAKGRGIKDNAIVHAHSKYILKLDIKSFYPSIHNTKVYKYFIKQECSPDVSHLLTALTTYNYSLPLGASTSPMLADQIVRPIDLRINGIAKKAFLRYTRYVDDITLSGNFDLERMSKTVTKILKQSGFKIKKDKLVFYTPSKDEQERIITGVRITNGRISAPLDYVSNLENELKSAIYQSRKEIVVGEFYNRVHYRGKIAYINWLDPKLGQRLLKLYRQVKWRHLEWALRSEDEGTA